MDFDSERDEKQKTRNQRGGRPQLLKKDPKIKNCYVEYVSVKNKPLPEVRIFNPERYSNNVLQKKDYETELEAIYEKYGKKLEKSTEPQYENISWKYILRQAEEAGKDFASEREERIKIKRKLVKYSQNNWSKLEQGN